jgi:hypothetical protein
MKILKAIQREKSSPRLMGKLLKSAVKKEAQKERKRAIAA